VNASTAAPGTRWLELHVVAFIVRRLTRDRPTVPLATPFDKIERIASDPQPSLFQRRLGQRNEGPEQRRRDALAKSGAPVASASSLHAEIAWRRRAWQILRESLQDSR
jgi:hypothetical protein